MTNESYLVRREIYQNLHEKNEAKEKKETTSRKSSNVGNESGSPGVAEQRRNYDETERPNIEK